MPELLVWLYQRNMPPRRSPRRFLIKNENVPPYGDTPSIYPDYGPSAGDLRSIKLARISVYGNID